MPALDHLHILVDRDDTALALQLVLSNALHIVRLNAIGRDCLVVLDQVLPNLIIVLRLGRVKSVTLVGLGLRNLVPEVTTAADVQLRLTVEWSERVGYYHLDRVQYVLDRLVFLGGEAYAVDNQIANSPVAELG